MKIIGLSAENVKRLTAVSLKPSSGVNKVSGKNAQGKTSLFDAIRMAFGGAKLTDDKPVREGEEKAVVELDLGEIVVKRSLTAKGGNTVTIKAKDGSTIKQPQEVLNKLYNKIAFDLMKFIQMKGKEQYGLLKDVLGVGDAIEQMESDYQKLYDERTVANRLTKEAQARLGGIEVDDLVGYEKTSIAEVIKELEVADAHNSKISDMADDLQTLSRSKDNAYGVISNHTDSISQLNKQIEELESRIKVQEGGIVTIDKDIEAKKAELEGVKSIDTQPIKEKMNRLEDTNAIVDQNVKHRDLAKEVNDCETKAKGISTKMEGITAKIKTTMEELKMPIAELSMAEGKVLYKGVPVDQASASEKIRVSMSIAMALQPELKVILVTDGSLLDSDSMAEVEKIAEENSFQVWIEIVDDSGDVGIVIEDGSVVAKEGA